MPRTPSTPIVVTNSLGGCQVPSKTASRVGNSGISPKPYSDSCFVADEAPGRLDVEHTILSSGQTVAVCVETTRYVGTVDADGFVVFRQQHIDQAALAEKLLLTVRARISAVEVGGILGVDDGGRLLEVEAFLHKGTSNEVSLGKLAGTFGTGNGGWQDFELIVDVANVRFPSDPAKDSTVVLVPQVVPASNEITFVLTGTTWPVTMEVDWLMLEPLDSPTLAWLPVLLLHGVGVTSASFAPGTAWPDGLDARDVGWHAPDLTSRGSFLNNAAEIGLAVAALKERFGVERVHILGHSKGGIDAREYVEHHDDVETLMMLGSPNAGSFAADAGLLALPLISPIVEYASGYLYMSSVWMQSYNLTAGHNPATTYATAAGDHDVLKANAMAIAVGPNDDIVAVSSVEALAYASVWTYITADRFTNHSGLRYNTRIVDELFAAYIATVTPPQGFAPRTSREGGFATLLGPAGRRAVPDATADITAPVLQNLSSSTGVVAPGASASHRVVVDAVGAAMFLVFGDPAALRVTLVSPTGVRIDASTEATNPAVTSVSCEDAGSLSHAGYSVDQPEVGDWTVEVTNTDVSSSSERAHAVTALAAVAPGVGVVLAASLDRDRPHVGQEVTIGATVTDGGAPVTNATVEAVIGYEDGTIVTEVTLEPDGTDGQYSGRFTPAAAPGAYVVIVSAQRDVPAFVRKQALVALVSQSGTAFSGTVTDHGVDTDGDGLYDRLVVHVELNVDVEGTYRVSATLTDGAGATIQHVRAEQDLRPGLQNVSLSFDGARLFTLGYDGPYVLDDVIVVEASTSMGLDRAAPYTTSTYAHTQFQRPVLVLTGRSSDVGVSIDGTGQPPYSALVVSVEVDAFVGVEALAQGKLYSSDGVFVAASETFAVLSPGINAVALQFAARDIYRSGKSGPFELRLLSIWGNAATGPVSLRGPRVVCVTAPYSIEDFAEAPHYTVGGTLSGLVGTDLVLTEILSGSELRPSNGPFVFDLPWTTGSAYDVRITRQPTAPIQLCSIANAAGTIDGSNITDIAVQCITPPFQDGLDPSFGVDGKLTADSTTARAIALQSDGKIVVLGTQSLLRFESDGRLDASFGAGGAVAIAFALGVSTALRSVAIQPDGRIIVAGHARVGLQHDFALACYTADGLLDATFGDRGNVTTDFDGGVDEASSVLLQPDGKIVVVGYTSIQMPLRRIDFAVARYTATGTLDTTFGSGGKVTTQIAGADLAAAAALLPDGSIVAAGRTAEDGGADPDFGVVRYTLDGALDPTFGVNGIVRTDFGLSGWLQPAGLALQGDGKLVVVGFADVGGTAVFAIARFETNGALDPTFGSGGLATLALGARDSRARAVCVRPDGTIVVAGQMSDGTRTNFALARYTASGLLDPGFGVAGMLTVDFLGGSDSAECIAMQRDGKILVGGSAVNVRTTGLGLLRLLA